MRPNVALAPQFEDLAIQPLDQRPTFQVIAGEGLGATESPVVASLSLVNSENIPELSLKRRNAADNASKILAQNRSLIRTGKPEAVPTSVDALGTARQVVETKKRYGEDSPQYQEVRTGLILDSERLLAEAYSKNTAEYFAKITQNRDQSTGEYFSHGLSISRMVHNGLSPSAEPEEQDRRVNEYVEEATYEAIGSMIGRVGLRGAIQEIGATATLPAAGEHAPAQPNLSVMTISECTDYAIEGYKINAKASHGGYAPAVEKIMIRGVHYFDDAGDRQEEQAAVPGLYINHEIVQTVLAKKAAVTAKAEMTKTEIHGSQFISVNGESVMDLIKELDQEAGAVHGKNIFMGEAVAEDHPKDYDEFVEDAEVRRAKLAPKPTQLAEYLIALEEKGTDPRVATALVDKFLKATLLEVASKHPELAEAMFDKATAVGFSEVARLDALGRTSEARQLQQRVEKEAPEVSYCGADSCGLEGVDPNSPAGKIAAGLGLSGTILRNTEQACTNCHELELHHDYNGNTACVNCRSTKLKGEDVKIAEKAEVASLDKKRQEKENHKSENRH